MRERLEDLPDDQLERTFRTNIFGQFYLTRAVLPHMPEGGAIINTTSVTAYQGHPVLLDYASSKGAIVAFTRSLSKQLLQRGIRVNGVAPGPIWTPLIPASYSEAKTAEHGSSAPMERPGQPDEVALLHLPRLAKFSLHVRPGPASQRRYDRKRLTGPRISAHGGHISAQDMICDPWRAMSRSMVSSRRIGLTEADRAVWTSYASRIRPLAGRDHPKVAEGSQPAIAPPASPRQVVAARAGHAKLAPLAVGEAAGRRG